jgi:hypothetical protein
MYAPFVITGILQEDPLNKVDSDKFLEIRNLLLNNIELSSYGSGLKGISFFFIVLPENNQNHRSFNRFSQKNLELHLQVRLPFAEIRALTHQEVLRSMAQNYLQSLKKYLPKKKIQDFDSAAFLRDVERLFVAQGWFKVAVAE